MNVRRQRHRRALLATEGLRASLALRTATSELATATAALAQTAVTEGGTMAELAQIIADLSLASAESSSTLRELTDRLTGADRELIAIGVLLEDFAEQSALVALNAAIQTAQSNGHDGHPLVPGAVAEAAIQARVAAQVQQTTTAQLSEQMAIAHDALSRSTEATATVAARAAELATLAATLHANAERLKQTC